MTVIGLGEKLVLEVEGKPLPKEIDETILATGLTRTTEGSSTLSITARDPEKKLQKAGYFERKAEAFLFDKDGVIPFVACSFDKKSDEYTLEFEDRDFNLLKEGPGSALKVAVQRTHYMTLARFVKEQCKRMCPHAGFICPQLNEQPPREAEKSKSIKTPTKGIAKGSMTIGGQSATADQEKVAEELLEVVAELGGNEAVGVAIIYAALGETKLGADAGTYERNSAGCWGVLQSKDMPNPRDTKGMARNFVLGGEGFQGGGAKHLSKTVTNPEQIAVEVEVPSIWPSNAYATEGGDLLGDAQGIVKAYGGASSTATTKTSTVFEALVFELNGQVGTSEEGGEEENQENALEGIEGLLKPGNWQFYKIGNDFYLMTQEYMKKLKPVKVLSEKTKGILDIGWKLDYNEKKKTWEVEIECRAQLWEGEPGEVLAFALSVGKEISSKKGWFVQTIERKDITDNATTIKLILPEAGKPEKADAQKQVTSKIAPSGNAPSAPGKQQVKQAGPGAGHLKEDSILYNALFQMKWIAAQNYPYVWGGGHTNTFQATFGTELTTGRGYDCSGSLSSVLHAAGILAITLSGELGGVGGRPVKSPVEEPQDAEWFKTWGQPGKGEHLTVWASDGHCFIEVNVPESLGPENTEGATLFFVARKRGTTVGFYPDETTSGFTARHWPGT